MPISAPDVQQGWSSHQLPGARYFILTHKPKPHKWLIAVTAPLPLLSSYWHWSRQILIETLIGTERLVCCQEGTRTPHHLQTASWNNGEKRKLSRNLRTSKRLDCLTREGETRHYPKYWTLIFNTNIIVCFLHDARSEVVRLCFHDLTIITKALNFQLNTRGCKEYQIPRQ